VASSVVIVPASGERLDEILHLEQACFSAPWTRKMIQAELTGNPFAHFFVALDATGAMVGYHCFWIVFEELRLMNLAVSESMRRNGIARALVTEALQKGLDQAATRAVLEVRASNQAARTLYQRMGFTTVGTRPQYYSNPVEDAILMHMEPLIVLPHASSGGRPHHGGNPVSAH
jgi:ribosomal-protein-alanine N-acetyltransferase